MNTAISIFLFLIILIALYQVYYYVNPKLLVDSGVINLTQSPQMEIPITDDENPSAVRYYYDGWVRINQISNDSTNLILFNRGNQFVVSIKGHQLSIVNLSSANSINTHEGTWKDESYTTVTNIATNLPYQRWVYFCINVDGNQIDVYLNGKLTSSVKGTDNISNKMDFTSYVNAESKLKVGNKYTVGGLARFRREVENMDPQSVWNTYMLGPGVNDNGDNNNPDYHAKIEIIKNNKARRTFNLF